MEGGGIGYADELLRRTGRSSAPSVWVRGEYVGGCDDGTEPWHGVVPMLASGKLAVGDVLIVQVLDGLEERDRHRPRVRLGVVALCDDRIEQLTAREQLED